MASGFLNPRLADPHAHPALANPYAIYFNPAALGGIEGTQIVIDGTLAYRHATDRSNGVGPRIPRCSATPTTFWRIRVRAAHPTLWSFRSSPGDRLQLEEFLRGLGAYFPFGGAVSWDRRDSFAGNSSAAERSMVRSDGESSAAIKSRSTHRRRSAFAFPMPGSPLLFPAASSFRASTTVKRRT